MMQNRPSHGFRLVCNHIFLFLWLGMTGSVSVVHAGDPRPIPKPLPGHPGNIYLLGEDVRIHATPEIPKAAKQWQVLDDRDRCLAKGPFDRAAWDRHSGIRIGGLGIGWYRIEFLDANGTCVCWTSAAVLAPLAAPIPDHSPIAIDVANAWFARDNPEAQMQFANLAALAGVRWVRDRLHWGELQPEPGKWVARTTYDTSATLQSAQGLNVLQVFHATPEWAVDRTLDGDHARLRFPRDLRHAYRFCRSLAERYRGRIQAWEPWNEANVGNFGSHTVDEMCAYQKAAYLGFKAGDPDLIVGWNAYAAIPTERHTEGVIANRTWPYFDTYNLHTYDWPNAYVRLWEPARAAACGRPIWITESDRGIPYQTGPPWYDLAPQDERRKAELLAQSYAMSLFAGASRHFHFILGHYVETSNQVQFGLLRHDLTPRPSYGALAAIGRFLAGARCLGKWDIPHQPQVQVVAFRGQPDGRPRDLLVAWAEQTGDWAEWGKNRVEWNIPAVSAVDALFDYLGRPIELSRTIQLTAAPVFLLMPQNAADQLTLTAPLTPTRFAPDDREEFATPIVLQLEWPHAANRQAEGPRWSCGYVHTIEAGREMELNLIAYNLSAKKTTGRVRMAQIPAEWKITPDHWQVTLEPMERKRLRARIVAPQTASDSTSPWFVCRGDFGSAGRPVLAFQLVH